MGTNNSPVTFNYPNGLYLKDSGKFVLVSNGVLKFVSTTQEQLSNIKNINLSSNSTVYSIGPSTFFGNSKLSSVTLAGKGISRYNIFTANTGISANTNNTSDASAQYITTNVPFGSNESFTSLNYTGFTPGSSTSSTTAAELFATTNNTTWAEVAKIINSLSYQKSATSEVEAQNTKYNMSTWAVDASESSSSVINSDASPTWTAANEATSTEASVALSNSYTSSSSSTNSVTISATSAKATIIHNGITWTYTNDGSTIKLTGQANMYKATNSSSSSYLVFFNQTTYSVTSGSTYYVPSKTPVTVTLTIATASSSSAE